MTSEGDSVTSSRKIIRLYICTPSEFLVDVVVNFPYEILVFAFPPGRVRTYWYMYMYMYMCFSVIILSTVLATVLV